ncbi:hom, partial [Symbiodinium necroappetens]
TCDLSFYEELVAFCRREEIWIISDLAYAEVYFDGPPPPSILQVPGAKEIAVEFTSLSKTYSMPGWRIGFCSGNPKLIAALARVKSYAKVAVAPGVGFGEYGDGHVRLALVENLHRTRQAVRSIKAFLRAQPGHGAGDMTNALKIGVAGLGTVGGGVVELLAANGETIAERCGLPIHVSAVSAKDKRKDRGFDVSSVRWFDDAVAMAADPEIDLVVELIGGADGIAKTVVETALGRGAPVVTANKALVAHHGTALARLAEANGAALAYEAAVAGGIPAIKTIREGLAANRVERVHGILNGTCNFILSTMRESGREFGE